MAAPDEPRRRQPPAADFELDTYQLVLLRRGARLEDYDEAAVKRLQREHLAYLLGLRSAGRLLAAGAIVGHEALTGLAFYPSGHVEAVRRLTEDDPAVRAGIDAFEIVTLLCPKGAITFAPVAATTPTRSEED